MGGAAAARESPRLHATTERPSAATDPQAGLERPLIAATALHTVRVLAVALVLAVSAVAWTEEVQFEPILKDCTHFETLVFPPGRSAKVEGLVQTLVEDDPTPMPDVQLELRTRDQGSARYVLSSEDGSFSFGALPEGSYVLRTCRSGWDVLEVPIDVSSTAPDRRLVLTLAPSEAGGKPNVEWSDQEVDDSSAERKPGEVAAGDDQGR